MKIVVIIISICISTSCFAFEASFCRFSNTFLRYTTKEAPYNGKNHASFDFSGFDVKYYRCIWESDPAIRYIKGEVTIYFTFSKALKEISFDLRNALLVDSVIQKNKHLPFIRRNDTLIIQLSDISKVGELDSVTIFYQGVPANSGFGTFTNSIRKDQPVMWTLSEPFGARDWWPCQNGLDDKADSIDIYIITPKQYTAVSNGLRQSVIAEGERKTTHWKHRYPIASYLVCLAIAPYEEFESYYMIGKDSLLMQTFCYEDSLAVFKEKTALVIESMRYFTELLGTYPFIKEKYGHTQMIRSGGMEHQTNTFISSPDESLMAHELAHQWFGNTITSGSWNDIWLSEGFATLLASMDMERKYPATVHATRKKEIDKITLLPNGSVYVPEIKSVSRIFDSRLTYSKSSRILNMLRFILGDSTFFKGVNTYLKDVTLQFGFAHTADFKKNMESVSGKNLSYFFTDWVYGQGYPSYKILWSQSGSNHVTIKVNQTTSDSSVSFFALPIPLLFKNITQQKTVIVDNTFNGETFFEKIGFIADTVLIDPDYWLITKNNSSEKIIDNTGPIDEVLIYPNPVYNSLHIYLKNSEANKATLKLFDASGRLILRDNLVFAGRAAYQEIDLKEWPKGIYFLHLETNKKLRVVKRILKQ